MSSKRLAQFLGLRWALVVFLAIPCVATILFPISALKDEGYGVAVGVGLLIAIPIAIVVYVVRSRIRNDGFSLPSARLAYPAFAARAGVAASLGFFATVCAVAIAIWIDPFGRRPVEEGWQVMRYGATAGTVLGALVYLLSPILYLPVQRPLPQEDEAPAGVVLVGIPTFITITGVSNGRAGETFWVSLGHSATNGIAIPLVFVCGWFVYTKLLPEGPNPLSLRKDSRGNSLTWRSRS